ncbi:MAG: transposase [Hyphomicrobiales bacterium]|nr:transposase [Hyphomicrobiales bacterium]
MRQRNRSYTPEFREEAIRLVESSDRTTMEIAESLGVNAWTLRGWYRQAMAKRKVRKSPVRATAPADETAEQRADRLEEENRKLLKRVQDLETDRAILKKAAAFFAKESD